MKFDYIYIFKIFIKYTFLFDLNRMKIVVEIRNRKRLHVLVIGIQ